METLNIYQKLAKIRKPVEVLQKNKAGYNYTYVSEDEILAKITAGMNKYGVSLIPSYAPKSMNVLPYHYEKTKARKDGTTYTEQVNELVVYGDMEFHWVNNDNPDERVIVPWAMIGQQADASQAFGSGLTYATRYFLLKYFNIATSNDDPDNFRKKQQDVLDAENAVIAESIVDTVHEFVTKYLADHPDDKPKVVEIVKKYAKSENGKASANYYEIKDPVVASSLKKELEEKFATVVKRDVKKKESDT